MEPGFPTNRPLLLYVIGKDSDYIGRVLYRYLFMPGQIQIIKDKATNKWRAYRPWTDEDKDRAHEAQPAPPFIPPEVIDPKGWAYENKAERVFSICRLYFGEGHPMNGTTIRAFGSRSDPAMGDPVDYIWIDEDIDNEDWATEMEARLSDRKGKMLWSAFPLLRNQAMTKISRRAEEQKGIENPTTQEFLLRFSDNPFMDDAVRAERYANWSDEERRARDYGEYVTESILCYPEYSRTLHCLPRKDQHEPDPLEMALEANNWKVPEEWTRWMSVDPGHSICAVLFAAIPPPDIGDYVLIYDMLYIRGCSARMFGAAVGSKTKGQNFEAFVIDDHGSRVTQAGAGVTIRSQYVEALKDNDVESNMTQSGFYLGCDDVQGRMAIVRGWMADRPKLGPKLRFLSAKCMDLLNEFGNFKKRICYGKHAVDEVIPLHNHACNALEYLAARNPRYTPPRIRTPISPVYQRYQKMIQKQGRGSVNLGPPSPDTTTR
jgi:hypothetical protein